MADNLNITWSGLNSQSTVEKKLSVNSGSYFFEIPQYSQYSKGPTGVVGNIRVYFTCTETSFKLDKIVYHNPTDSRQFTGDTFFFLGGQILYESGSITPKNLYSFSPEDGGQFYPAGLAVGETVVTKPNTLITSNNTITNNYLKLKLGTYRPSGYEKIWKGFGLLRSGSNNNLGSSDRNASTYTQYFTLELNVSDKPKLPLPTYTGATEFIYSGDLININSNISIPEETQNRCTVTGFEYSDAGNYNLSFKINSPDQFAWEGIQGDTYSIPWKIKPFSFDSWLFSKTDDYLKFKDQAYTGSAVTPQLSQLINNDIPKILNSNNIQVDYSDNIQVTDAAKAIINIKKIPAILNNIYSYTNDDLHNPASYSTPTVSVKLGDTGNNVKWVQAMLYNLDYDISIDGSFGSGTESIVKQFQEDNALSVDGSVGAGTRTKMIELWNNKKSKVDTRKIILFNIKILVDAYIRLNNSWKKAKELYIKTNTGWKKAKELYIRNSSSWKKSI